MRILLVNCYSKIAHGIMKHLDDSHEIIGAAPYQKFGLVGSFDRIFTGRRVRAVVRYANPVKEPQCFTDDVIAACQIYEPDVIFPVGQDPSVGLSQNKAAITDATKAVVLVDDYERLQLLADKWSFYNLCVKTGVLAPRTRLLSFDDEAVSALREFSYPVVLKPRMGTSARGVEFVSSYKDLVRHRSRLERLARLGTGTPSTYIVQEVVRGELRDVAMSARQGELVSVMTQERLQTLYDFGGGGILNRTTHEPELLEYAEKVVKEVRWTGVAYIDCIKTEAGGYYAIECNPRFWGTTQLSLEAGVDFANDQIRAFTSSTALPRKRSYEVGLVFKWYFPDCVAHWLSKPFSLANFLKRCKRTFRRYEGTRTVTNLKLQNLMFLLGIIVNKTGAR